MCFRYGILNFSKKKICIFFCKQTENKIEYSSVNLHPQSVEQPQQKKNEQKIIEMDLLNLALILIFQQLFSFNLKISKRNCKSYFLLIVSSSNILFSNHQVRCGCTKITNDIYQSDHSPFTNIISGF